MLEDIQWISSKTGERIPVIQNLTLCSKYNPQKESIDWVSDFAEVIPRYRYIIVLGIGGGFHIKELVKQFANKVFLIIDPIQNLVEEISKEFQHLNNIYFISQDIFSSKELNEALKSSSYRVLRYEPSCRLANKFYNNLELTLLGRTSEGLQKIIDLKSQQDPYYKIMQTLDLNGNESIKDIVPLIRQKKLHCTEDNVWFLLRELVS